MLPCAMDARVDRCGDCAAICVAEDDEERRLQMAARVLQLPATSGDITFPATRTMNSSPKPASKISSGGTRESLQQRIVA